MKNKKPVCNHPVNSRKNIKSYSLGGQGNQILQKCTICGYIRYIMKINGTISEGLWLEDD